MNEWNLPELNSMPVSGQPRPKYRLALVHASASFLPKVSDALAPLSLPNSSMTPESLHSVPLSFSFSPLGELSILPF